MKTNQIRTAKAIYSELARASETATITCVSERLTGRQRKGKA